MKLAYPIVLTPDPSGYVVFVPDLNINTEGRNIAEAIDMAADAIGLCGISLQDLGREIPAPSTAPPPCAEGEIAAFALVDFDACRRAHEQRSVRKSVTIPAYLNELAEAAHINFSQILQEGLKQRLDVP
ncbi:MAG: HicB family protein [Lawsonibacter sp.]|nr:HicB family protein [Lawsonibacter sp.]